MGSGITIEAAIAFSKSSQNKKELTYLVNEVLKIKPEVVLEIGAWRGYSAELWAQIFRSEHVITVDNDADSLKFLKDRQRKGELDYLRPSCISPIFGDSGDQETYNTIREMIEGVGIDFLFIDGDHHYEAVKRDYELYGTMVNPGGIIAFHDIDIRNHPELGVYRLWDEIVKSNPGKTTSVWAQTERGMGTGLLYV